MKHTHVRIVQGKKVIQEFDIDAQSMAIKATPNTDFLLVEKATGKAPQKLKITRKGNDLILTADDGETMLTINDYYTTSDVEILGVLDKGVASYHLNSSQMYTAIGEMSSATHYLDISQEAVVAVSGAKPYLLALGGLGAYQIARLANNKDNDKPTTPNNSANTQPSTQPQQPKPNLEPAKVSVVEATNAIDEGKSLEVKVILDNANGNNGGLDFNLPSSDNYDAPTFSAGVRKNTSGKLVVPQGVKEFVVTVPIKADKKTETAPQTLTITVGNETKTVTINDTSKKDESVTPNPTPLVAQVEKISANPSVDEGERMVATVTLSDGNGNPSVPFVLQGVQEADYDKTLMSFSNGVTQNANGTLNVPKDVKEFTITLPIIADKLTDANEKLTINVGGKTSEIVINDTSTTPAPIPQPTLLFSFASSERSVEEEVYGATVATLSVQNAPVGETYTYAIKDSRFEVVDNVLKLKDDVKLDYEAEKAVSLEVTYTNQKGVLLSTSYLLDVKDIDEQGYKWGTDDADDGNKNQSVSGTNESDVLIGKKGNDRLNGYLGSDTYIFRKGDGKDVIEEAGKDNVPVGEHRENVLDFRGVNSKDVAVSHYHLKITLTYGDGDSVTFAPSAFKSIRFADTVWDLTDRNVRSEKLGISYWHEALVDNQAEALIHVDKNQDGKLSYAFPAQAMDFGQDSDRETARTTTQFTNKQQEITKSILDELAEFLPFEFTPTSVAGTEPQSDTIYLQNSRSLSGAGGKARVIEQGGGTVWIDGDLVDNSYPEEAMRFLIAHELGHALGLVHPRPHEDFEKPLKDVYVLDEEEDIFDLTIMTDVDEWRNTMTAKYHDFDISALQYLYGVNPNVSPNNDIYRFDSTKGVFVWDGAGEHDVINASSATANVYINLNAGTHSYLGQKSAHISDANQLTINHGTVIEGAIGGSGNDTLIGNSEDNALFGGAGSDILTGGLGQDVFVYDYSDAVGANHATGNNGRDTITDFTVGNTANNVNADLIELTDLLKDYNDDKSTLSNYLSIQQTGNDSVLSIDRDGAGTTYAMTELVVLQGVNVDLATLIANGQII